MKAYCVRNVGHATPHIHDLLRLAELAGLELSADQRQLLDEVTAFNIRARYPDYKNRFYRTATPEFSQRYIDAIRGFREWLLLKITA